MLAMRARDVVVFTPLLAAALAGAVGGRAGRGADEAFLLGQARPAAVTAPAVERLMRTAPDPRPPHKSRAIRSRCRAGGRRDLRNPWRCTVDYASGSVARFVVTLRSVGSYLARYLGGTATATGFCLRGPGAG